MATILSKVGHKVQVSSQYKMYTLELVISEVLVGTRAVGNSLPTPPPLPLDHLDKFVNSQQFADMFWKGGKDHVPYPYLKGALAKSFTDVLRPEMPSWFKRVSVTQMYYDPNVNEIVIEMEVMYE